MKKYEYKFVNSHRKIVCAVGFGFAIFLGCFTFPIINLSHKIQSVIMVVNFIVAVASFKCIGELESVLFLKTTMSKIAFLNFVLTVLGMASRYLLEFGEVSNTYNFTLPNILFHIVVAVFVSTISWRKCVFLFKTEKYTLTFLKVYNRILRFYYKP